MSSSYYCIGVMTGNSLDAVDAVLTHFEGEKISDICGHSIEIPSNISFGFRRLKEMLAQNDGDIKNIAANPKLHFKDLHDAYVRLVAQTVNELIEKSNFEKNKIVTHLPVAFDFRSDDLMNGGEAAPLAPVHNQHLARDLKAKGIFPVAFCNGGNTGNIAIVYENKVIGWDTGPFNHFVDYLVRSEKHENCDWNGKYGKQGKIDLSLLNELFNHAVQTQSGENFLLKNPPKSSDPAWYKNTPKLIDTNIAFADRVRTVEFFSAYIFAYALRHSPIGTPSHFLIFGGGWNNPIIKNDFQNLLRGKAPILPEHEKIFQKIEKTDAEIVWSDDYGYNGKYMEARIFADMARCLLTREPFSYPETTGCQKPTIGGILALPGRGNARLWSRAAYGWQKQID